MIFWPSVFVEKIVDKIRLRIIQGRRVYYRSRSKQSPQIPVCNYTGSRVYKSAFEVFFQSFDFSDKAQESLEILTGFERDLRFRARDNALKPIPSVYECVKVSTEVSFSWNEMSWEVLKLICERTFEIAVWDHRFVPYGIVSKIYVCDPFERVGTLFSTSLHRPLNPIPWLETNTI